MPALTGTTPMAVDVRIPLTGGRTLPAAFGVPGGSGPLPAVLVIHEALGVTGEIRRIVQRLAREGYVALAPDFLAGLGPKPFCIARFMRGIGRRGAGRPYRQLDAARAWLTRRDEVGPTRIGVAGFCMLDFFGRHLGGPA